MNTSSTGPLPHARRSTRQVKVGSVAVGGDAPVSVQSMTKTDTRDSRNMAKALWVFMVTGEFGLPTVYKPSCAVRELRRLFTYYDLVTRQIRMLKNGIQALLVENGVELKEGEKNKLLSPLHGPDLIRNYELSSASMTIIAGEMDLLGTLTKKKDEAVLEILRAGEVFQDQVELLITIRGITPLTALAFLSDVGDISRFNLHSREIIPRNRTILR